MISTNIDNMIAKIIRDTRLSDASYFADMYEWIPEAMRLLKTSVELKVVPHKLYVHNHQAKLPCGLIELLAVEYKGYRLRYYTGIRPGGSVIFTTNNPDSIFEAFPTIASMPSGNVLDIQYAMALPFSPSDGYQLHMDYISTTFDHGELIVYIKEAPTDERGIPLVPDHADYREALYWFVRSKLIQSGYNDVVYGHDDRIPYQRFEVYAGRAISDITYPSVDQKEAQLAQSVRFVPPMDYWESFFNTELKEPIIGDTLTSAIFSSPQGPLANSIDQ